MNDKEYIEQRLDDQKNWYSKNSQKNQRWHKRLQTVQILAAACIPFLPSVIGNQSVLNTAVGGLGVLIALTTGVSALNKFDEKWIKYRTTAEALKHEKMLYLTGATPYDGEDPFHLLVQRVETLISTENRDWSQYITKPAEKENAG